MILDHRNHYYKPSESTWEHEYVLWMKAKDEIRRFYKHYPHNLDNKVS